MRIFSIVVLCFMFLSGCEDPKECRFVGTTASFRSFELCSLDMEFELGMREPELYASLIETPTSGTSGNFVLRDMKGNDCRFCPAFDLDWEIQLDRLQLGETYRFVFSIYTKKCISGMKIFDEDLLLYLAASYSNAAWGYNSFPFSRLEGFAAEQSYESKCDSIRIEEDTEYGKLITDMISLPVIFQYGEQSITLYHTQEAVLKTSEGEFLVHLLYSSSVSPQNYDNGGQYYSFYIKRLL